VLAIRDRLREMYGTPTHEPHGDPVHELVLTILSQNTSDANRDVAYAGLRAAFGSWEEVRDAPTEEVEEAIRPGGLARGAADLGERALQRHTLREQVGDLLGLAGAQPQAQHAARGLTLQGHVVDAEQGLRVG